LRCVTAIGHWFAHRAAADVAASAYVYFSRLFSGVEPGHRRHRGQRVRLGEGRQPYGLPFFNDDDDQIRPGIVVMPAGSGDFWIAIGRTFAGRRRVAIRGWLATYTDGTGGLDLQAILRSRDDP